MERKCLDLLIVSGVDVFVVWGVENDVCVGVGEVV